MLSRSTVGRQKGTGRAGRLLGCRVVKIESTPLAGLYVIEPRVFNDARGWFMETFHELGYGQAGLDARMVQANHSQSRRGTVRGLHFQRPPHAQGKLVQCVQGSIWDVAVDIRPDSPTFGCWAAAELTAEGGEMLYIPEDFAHGFQVLTETALVAYKCTREFH
ncbi:MAG: dTDP-4-dehydrorhamnose 3,5-epimerase, partial [Proteobacteria bacterium]|nr:dTDP-4-dehydrorhamnose 3,5-epimerase [Pseudomonadota bacterium]